MASGNRFPFLLSLTLDGPPPGRTEASVLVTYLFSPTLPSRIGDILLFTGIFSSYVLFWLPKKEASWLQA